MAARMTLKIIQRSLIALLKCSLKKLFTVSSGPEINLARFSLKLLQMLLNYLKKAKHSSLLVKKMPNHLKKW
jgi:hypothetical protein